MLMVIIIKWSKLEHNWAKNVKQCRVFSTTSDRQTLLSRLLDCVYRCIILLAME